MINKVYNFINKYNMIEQGDKIVAGISGGADSMCMLAMLLELSKKIDIDIIVVHINHGIRGEEALHDEEYVRHFCEDRSVPFECYRIDIKAIARDNNYSEEEAGRIERYRAFNETLLKYKANKIAVAHNLNDKSETVLHNLFRGTGLKGLTGISPVRDNIIRPLLCLSRSEIERYVNENNIEFCTDRTNFEDDYTRNKIRLNILPYVEENINSQASANIANTSFMMDEIQKYFEEVTENAFINCAQYDDNSVEFELDYLKEQNIVIIKSLVRKAIEMLSKSLKDITNRHIESIAILVSKEVNKSVNLPYGLVAIRSYDKLIIRREKIESEKQNESIIVEDLNGTYKWGEYVIEFTLMPFDKKLHDKIPTNTYTKWFDYGRIKGTLSIRGRRTGDFLVVNSQGGRKKLKQYYTDEKIPACDRDEVLLIAEDNSILWVAGHRISEAYKVTEDTESILQVRVYGGN